MIVVTIVGLLSAVAVPKFADMMRKANEAVTKSNLGVLRSVVSIYYADHYGIWPYQNAGIADWAYISVVDPGCGALVPKYVSAIPALKTGQLIPNEGKNDVATAVDGITLHYDTRDTIGSQAAWVYYVDLGTWYVNCEELDTKGEGIHTW